MGAADATLGGIRLNDARVVEWSLRVGTDPYIQTFEFHESEAAKVDALTGLPVTLSIRSSDDKSVRVNQLFVIGAAPASQYFLRAFYVADIRWLWQRKHVYRDYNRVRRTGTKYLLAGVPTAITAPLDNFVFADASLLNDAKRYKARDVLEDLLKEVSDGKYRIEGQVPDVPVQGLEIDDPGNVAISRILDQIGFKVIVDYDGTAVAFDGRDLSKASAVMKAALPEIDGSAFAPKASLRAIRPGRMVPLFNRECELAFRSVEEDESATVTENQLYMVNVIPSPDDQITVTIGGSARAVGRGTYVPLPALLDAWNEDRPTGAPPLTLDFIRKHWLMGNAIEANYCQLGERNPPLPNWVARIAALRQHFRVTYQISNKWMRRIKGLRPYRLGIYDPLNGVHAPAGVFMDYATEETWKGLLEGTNAQYLWLNIHGFPAQGTHPDSSDAKQAPATVEVLDEDLGVIHIAFKRDTLGYTQTYHPSLIVDEAGREIVPTANVADWRKSPLGRDFKVQGTQGFLCLSSSHRVCVVLTAIPASPNTQRQLHDVEVVEGQIAQHFAGVEGAKGGEGHAWHLRVGPQVVNARILWQEEREGLYERIFGLDAGRRGVPSREIPAEMIANKEQIEEVARATAAGLWSGLLDRYEGSRMAHFTGDPSIRPQGNIDVVSHALGVDGVMRTTVAANRDVRGPNPLAYLPDSVRTAVYRILPPTGA